MMILVVKDDREMEVVWRPIHLHKMEALGGREWD